jgi:metal-responsive CopG/Arc/MetJ family transcriptional regulator
METMAVEGKKAGDADTTTRASVSFPRSLYIELERIAKHKKVSVAWVVRDAAEKYIADQWPLLERNQDRA